MVIEFPFEEFFTENLGKIRKPFAAVRIIHGNKQLDDVLLIDSGADVTLIPKDRGDVLKLKKPRKSEMKYLGGIAGGVAVVYRTVALQVEDVTFRCRIAWAQTDDVPSVLGRVDVFDIFDIEFKQKDKKVLFKKK